MKLGKGVHWTICKERAVHDYQPKPKRKYPPTRGKTPEQIAEDRREIDEINAEITQESERIEMKIKQERKQKRKPFVVVAIAALVILVCLSAVVVFMHITSQSLGDGYVKVCELSGEGSIWKEADAGAKGELIWQSSKAGYELSEDDDEIYNKVLKSSKWFDGYYFYPNGERFYAKEHINGRYTVYAKNSKFVRIERLGQAAFLAKPMKCDGLGKEHKIFQLEKALYWFTIHKKYWLKEAKELKIAIHNDIKKYKLFIRNRSAVVLDDEVIAAASEFFGLQFVDRKPVFIGRMITEYKSGTPEVEKSSYFFVWGDIKLNLDCKTLQGAPFKLEADDKFKGVVKPFKVKICARVMKIGLDSITREYAEEDGMVKKRTLYFKVDSERYLAEETRSK